MAISLTVAWKIAVFAQTSRSQIPRTFFSMQTRKQKSTARYFWGENQSQWLGPPWLKSWICAWKKQALTVSGWCRQGHKTGRWCPGFFPFPLRRGACAPAASRYVRRRSLVLRCADRLPFLSTCGGPCGRAPIQWCRSARENITNKQHKSSRLIFFYFCSPPACLHQTRSWMYLFCPWKTPPTPLQGVPPPPSAWHWLFYGCKLFGFKKTNLSFFRGGLRVTQQAVNDGLCDQILMCTCQATQLRANRKADL